MAQIEYYDTKPVDPFEINSILRSVVDGVVGQVLAGQGSAAIQFLFKYFGPTDTANDFNRAISTDGDFVYLDAERIVAESLGKVAITDALMARLGPQVLAALAAAGTAPIAAQAIVAGAAAGLGAYLFKTFAQPVVDNLYDIFGVASTKLEVTNGSGQIAGGVVYRNGLQGITAITAAMNLLSWSTTNATNKPGVDSHVQLSTNGNSVTGFDVLSSDVLAQIAENLGKTTNEIGDRPNGLSATGQITKNSDLLASYLSPDSTRYSIMETGSKLDLHMYNKGRDGIDIRFSKDAMSFGGSLSGLKLNADQIAAFGTSGTDILDFGAATGQVYAYGGLGSDTITGGRAGDILWGDIGASSANGEIDFIHGGGGADEIFGGGGGDQLFGEDGDDFIKGGEGDDIIDGGNNDDQIWGDMGADTIHGGSGADRITGGSDVPGENDRTTNQLYGDAGNDSIYGALGDDILSGGADDDYLDGAAGIDTALYDDGGASQTITLFGGGSSFDSNLTVARGSETDVLHSIEKIKLSSGDDTLKITNVSNLTGLREIDGGEGRNILDLTLIGNDITFEHNKIKGYDTQFKGFEVLKADPGNDTIILKGSDAQSWREVDFGSGNNTIDSSVVGLTINLGSGNNTVKGTGPGTIVKSGGGANKVEASHNGQLLFENASTADRITYYGSTLTGGVHWGGSESPYAYGIHGERYGRNQQGDLVIVDASGNQTFIPRFNFSTDGASRTAGLYVIDVHFEIRSGNIWTTAFEAAAIMLKSLKQIGLALHGTPLHGTDPLVLDLDGNGIPLTGREISGVSFDINNNRFATPTGWVDASDGILVRDLNGNGKIDNDSEMFGGPQTAGFAQLATLDGNHDGKVDATDNGLADFNGDGTVDAADTFDSLKVWVDANQDGVTDAGELHALSDYDIVSIAVGSTPSTLTDSGNDIVATGTFQRADGTTGMVGEVQFDTDNHNTRWTGDSSVSAAAASRPDLKGFGTLTDLHVAMTLDPGLIDVVDAASPGLNSLSLASLRAAVQPLLGAWGAAVPIPAGTPGAEPTEDFNFVGATTVKGATVHDYLVEKQDNLGTYYAYASGQFVYDANGVPIDRPTREQVLASTPHEGHWDKLSAADIAFLERYTGNLIGLSTPVNPTAQHISEVAGALTSAWNEINKLAVRLAAQGPLSPFFAGIAYDATSDFFRPTTDYQLQPMLQQIFAATPAAPADAEAWLKQWNTIIGMMMSDYRRDDEGRQVTDPFLFESIVAAYENTPVAISIKDAATALFDVPQSEIFMGPGAITGGDTTNDILYFNGPNETAIGQGGQDAYVVGYNFGQATIRDEWQGLGDSQEDSIWFAHLNVSDLTFTREGIDLVISQNGTSEQIRVVNEFAGRRPGLVTAFQDFDESVEVIKFADGTTWVAPMAQRQDRL